MSNLSLSYTQAKNAINAGIDMRSLVEEFNTQPGWLVAMGGIEDIYEVAAIIEGGCASGAYMPAVTYNTASRVMSEWGDDILEYLEKDEAPKLEVGDSWNGYASRLLSAAVELWASQFQELLEIL